MRRQSNSVSSVALPVTRGGFRQIEPLVDVCQIAVVAGTIAKNIFSHPTAADTIGDKTYPSAKGSENLGEVTS